MMNKSYDYWFANLIGIGNINKIQLIQTFCSAKEIYYASKDKLLSANVINLNKVQIILDSKLGWNIEEEWKDFLKYNVGFLTYLDKEYPDSLKEISDAPYALYYLGDVSLLKNKCIGVVGARRCSQYGKYSSEELAYILAKSGYTVISGMAKGVDGAAHKGCLRAKGKTIAVLGCSVLEIYPPENKDIYDDIKNMGLIISEYPPLVAPLAENFPARNRIISGISKAIVVVEAKNRSGSLITADLALSQGRDVYVVPGRITDSMSFGCNKLISQGAGIIVSFEDFINELNTVNINTFSKVDKVESHIFLEKEEMLVYSCLDFYPKGIEQLQQEANINLLNVLSALVNLCNMKLAKECFVNQYIKLS